MTVGSPVGREDGMPVWGASVGRLVGSKEGMAVGNKLEVGFPDGTTEGVPVGDVLADGRGLIVGNADGHFEGPTAGDAQKVLGPGILHVVGMPRHHEAYLLKEPMWAVLGQE